MKKKKNIEKPAWWPQNPYGIPVIKFKSVPWEKASEELLKAFQNAQKEDK